MTNKPRHRLSAVCAALLLTTGVGLSATALASDMVRKTESGMTMSSHTMAKDDLEFMEKAAIAGKTEVQAAKIAATKSSDPAVRKFAQRMIMDHGKAGDELKSIAAEKNVTLPASLDDAHKSKLDTLEKLPPARISMTNTAT